jgi:hypothetical protein
VLLETGNTELAPREVSLFTNCLEEVFSEAAMLAILKRFEAEIPFECRLSSGRI